MDINISTFEQLKNICISTNKNIWEVAQEVMATTADISVEQVRSFTNRTLFAMKEAIRSGLISKELSQSGMCGDDCEKVVKRYEKEHSMFGTDFEKTVKYALATSEENIRMGTIAACPTAGSCGIVPAALIAVAQEYDISEVRQITALITAGEIGRIVSVKMPLAGAVGGCQA